MIYLKKKKSNLLFTLQCGHTIEFLIAVQQDGNSELKSACYVWGMFMQNLTEGRTSNRLTPEVIHQIDNDNSPMIKGMRTKTANRFRLLQESSDSLCLRPLSLAFSSEFHRRSCHWRTLEAPWSLSLTLVTEASKSSSENSVVTCEATVFAGSKNDFYKKKSVSIRISYTMNSQKPR